MLEGDCIEEKKEDVMFIMPSQSLFKDTLNWGTHFKKHLQCLAKEQKVWLPLYTLGHLDILMTPRRKTNISRFENQDLFIKDFLTF